MATGVDAETLKKFASDDEDSDARGDDSDSDSDGYGPDGLSFDQVLAEMKGEVKEKPSGVKSSTKSRVDKKKSADAFGAAGSAKKEHTVNFMAGKNPPVARVASKLVASRLRARAWVVRTYIC